MRGRFRFEPGEVISVYHASTPEPNTYSAIGYVPTESDISVTLSPGDNLVSVLPLRFGAVMASDLMTAIDSAVRVGGWNAVTQTTHWYPDSGDFLLPTCSPVHVEVSASSTWPPPRPMQGGGSESSESGSATGEEELFFLDADQDGFGDPSQSIAAVTPPQGYVANDDDCDDGDPSRHPGAREVCNEIDDDCDDLVDEIEAAVSDARGVACSTLLNPSETLQAGLSGPSDSITSIGLGYTVDLEELEPGSYGGSLSFVPMETAEYLVVSSGLGTLAIAELGGPAVASLETTGLSECALANMSVRVRLQQGTAYTVSLEAMLDGETVLTLERVTGTLFYEDADGDGHGVGEPVRACAAPPGFADRGEDCNDADASMHPGAEDVCDGLDNDCDGEVDHGQARATFFLDADGDGFGSGSTVEACVPPGGYVAVGGDCNDGNATIFPGSAEVCDGLDNDCDGQIDEGVGDTYFADVDGDGHGDPFDSTEACTPPAGYHYCDGN